MKAMYYSAVRTVLTQLMRIPQGNTIEEDHQRNRQLIVHYIMDNTGAIQKVERNGKTYLQLKDFPRMKEGVGMLLSELMRIKAEGDYDAIKALVDKYGVRFDPKLRDEVVARYARLNIPAYWCGINSELTPAFDSAGKVTAVKIAYPRDYVRQQLGYASMYGVQ
jgi:dipeptidyl-peptidase-3